MRKIVKEILEAESRVNEILQEARQKASGLRSAAEREMGEQITDARRQAQEIVQTAAEEGAEEAERVRQEALRQADERTQAEIDGKTDAMENLVTRICTLVLGTEYEMDGQ